MPIFCIQAAFLRNNTVQYYFRFAKTNTDRTDALDQMKSDSTTGRVQAVISVTWQEESNGGPVTIVKNFYYTDAYMATYLSDSTRWAFSATFDTSSIVGKVTAQPMFVTYDANGAVMATLAGESWTIQ